MRNNTQPVDISVVLDYVERLRRLGNGQGKSLHSAHIRYPGFTKSEIKQGLINRSPPLSLHQAAVRLFRHRYHRRCPATLMKPHMKYIILCLNQPSPQSQRRTAMRSKPCRQAVQSICRLWDWDWLPHFSGHDGRQRIFGHWVYGWHRNALPATVIRCPGILVALGATSSSLKQSASSSSCMGSARNVA